MQGAIADDIVGHVPRQGSLLTLEDFAATRSTWVEPISTGFAGHEMLEIPPNGQGLTALIALNILSHFGLARHEPEFAERHHLEIEAMKLAWELRNRHIADPDFAEVPVAELLSAGTAARLAGLIDMNRALDIRTAMRQSDTIYLTVVDREPAGRLLHQLDLLRLRIRHRDAGRPASACRTAAPASSPIPAIPIASARRSGRCTPSFRPWSRKDGGST